MVSTGILCGPLWDRSTIRDVFVHPPAADLSRACRRPILPMCVGNRADAICGQGGEPIHATPVPGESRPVRRIPLVLGEVISGCRASAIRRTGSASVIGTSTTSDVRGRSPGKMGHPYPSKTDDTVDKAEARWRRLRVGTFSEAAGNSLRPASLRGIAAILQDLHRGRLRNRRLKPCWRSLRRIVTRRRRRAGTSSAKFRAAPGVV